MKVKNQEILIKFNEVNTSNELDEILYQFRENINQLNNSYYLKESEDPFIYFIEYSNPQELINKLENYEKISTIVPVTCVLSNLNYIIAVITKKIRHKIRHNDKLNVTCHMESYNENKTEIETEIITRLKESIPLPIDKIDPMWDIHIFIIGEITAINIKRSNKNRNKFSDYC